MRVCLCAWMNAMLFLSPLPHLIELVLFDSLSFSIFSLFLFIPDIFLKHFELLISFPFLLLSVRLDSLFYLCFSFFFSLLFSSLSTLFLCLLLCTLLTPFILSFISTFFRITRSLPIWFLLQKVLQFFPFVFFFTTHHILPGDFHSLVLLFHTNFRHLNELAAYLHSVWCVQLSL